MKFCCEELEKAINEHNKITRAFYPSGIEYYALSGDSRPSVDVPSGHRIYNCPYCGKEFEIGI